MATDSARAGRARSELAALAAPYRAARADRWAPVPSELDDAIAADRALAAGARAAREVILVPDVATRLGPPASVARYAGALGDVPRERFVLPEDIAESADDTPLPLDRAGAATISAPHAYALTFGLLDLAPGDYLIELGTGTGYGAALAATVVGAKGRVVSIEVDPVLQERAVRVVSRWRRDAVERGASVCVPELIPGDGRAVAVLLLRAQAAALSPRRPSVALTYAIDDEPTELIRELPDGGRLVAPIRERSGDLQELVRWTRVGDAVHRTRHGGVRYVKER